MRISCCERISCVPDFRVAHRPGTGVRTKTRRSSLGEVTRRHSQSTTGKESYPLERAHCEEKLLFRLPRGEEPHCRDTQLRKMAGVVCPASTSALVRTTVALNQRSLGNSAGAVSVSAGGWSTRNAQPLVSTSCRARPSVVCKALDKDQIAQAKKFQLQATEVLAELLKSKNTQATASKYLDSLTEEFFMVASTYLEMAKKEGNVEVMKNIENVLEIAMAEKGKTLRPEIQLMNAVRFVQLFCNLSSVVAMKYFF
ncbi:hypothetical protein M758_5G031200 [Ceratodon purpureus]|nr:hypothetical protein M758_5G031200 [Ceratodon purpureus]